MKARPLEVHKIKKASREQFERALARPSRLWDSSTNTFVTVYADLLWAVITQAIADAESYRKLLRRETVRGDRRMRGIVLRWLDAEEFLMSPDLEGYLELLDLEPERIRRIVRLWLDRNDPRPELVPAPKPAEASRKKRRASASITKEERKLAKYLKDLRQRKAHSRGGATGTRQGECHA
jgi:hypothetical protein